MVSDFFFVMTSRLNQDCLEKLFSQVRSRIPTMNNPSLFEFNAIIAKIITMTVNCENDEDLMEVIDNVITESTADGDTLAAIYVDDFLATIMRTDDKEMGKIIYEQPVQVSQSNSARYFCGYEVLKLLKKTKCSRCRDQMIKKNPTLEQNSENFLNFKNYSDTDFFLQAPIVRNMQITFTNI